MPYNSLPEMARPSPLPATIAPSPAVWLATALAALLSVPATYASIRAYEVLTKTEPNPARIVWTPHIAMFWRLAIGSYVAGMVGTLVFMAARQDLGRTMRALLVAVTVVGAMIGAQGLLLP